MDECVILLLILIIITTVVIFYIQEITPIVITTAALTVGAGDCSTNPNKAKKIFIGDHDKLVIDGHNMIHRLVGGHVDRSKFKQTLKDISSMIIKAFPTQSKHIVVKNPPDKYAVTPVKKNKRTKKNSKEDVPYFSELVEISKLFPNITYHLAYADEKDYKVSKVHHMSSRDDFLSIMLAKGNYVVSQDRFRDFNRFSDILPFYHYSVTDGKIHESELINPVYDYSKLDTPTVGNHFLFQIISNDTAKRLGVENGSIYLTDNNPFGCMYIIRL